MVVCVDKEIPITKELEKAGGQIITYGALEQVPLSRFTIINYERDGAQVAVGVPSGNDHLIQEFRSGSHPYFALAADLVKFLIAADRK